MIKGKFKESKGRYKTKTQPAQNIKKKRNDTKVPNTILELRTTRTEMKNSLAGLGSREEMAEENSRQQWR